MKLPVPRHIETVPAVTTGGGQLDEQLLEIFFDQMPMGIAVFDTDLKLVRCSKTWSGFFVAYLGVDEDYVVPGRSIYDLIPENEQALKPLLDGVLSGHVVRQQAHRLEKDGIVTFWDVVFAPTFRDGEVVGFVDVVTDATERRLAYEALETRVAVLARLAATSTVDQPVQATLAQAADAAVEASGGTAASVCARPAPDVAAAFAATGPPGADDRALLASRPARRDVLRGDTGDLLVLPIETSTDAFGVLAVRYPAGYDFEDEVPALQAIADLTATALDNARLYAAAEQHAATLERQRLARELHDSVSQALFSITLHARTAQRLLSRSPGGASEQLADQLSKLCELSTGALTEMRALIFELRPGALADEGFAAALQRQAQALTVRDGLPITIRAPEQRIALIPAAEEHVYRIVLEALHNTVKHGRARQASVDIARDGTWLSVRVADDGVGFDPAAPHPGHLGQHTMHERAAAIGGVLTVDSRPGAGTRVELRVPLLA